MLTRRQQAIKFVRGLRARFQGFEGQSRPVFVLGAQRSGTNMFMDTLGRCPGITVYNETDSEAFERYRLKTIGELAPLVERTHTPVAVFKAICDSQRAQWLLDAFPDGRVIWLYRHYHDVVNSSLRQFREHRRYLHYILHDRETANWRAENLSPGCVELIRFHMDRDITDASARALIWYLRNQQFWLNGLDGHGDTLLMGYEQLVQEADQSWPRVFQFLGLDYEAVWIDSVSSRSVRRYEPPVIDPLIEVLCRDMLNRLSTYSTR